MQAAPLFAAQAAREAAPQVVTTPTSSQRRPPSVDDTNAQGASSLHLLAAQGSSEGLAVLLAHGADPNNGAGGELVLWTAVRMSIIGVSCAAATFCCRVAMTISTVTGSSDSRQQS